MAKFSVLLVCTANICRSPMAEGLVMQQLEERGLAKSVRVYSAGTRVVKAGPRPDQRAQAVSRKHGIDISRLKAAPVTQGDFRRRDLILSMDEKNERDLIEICPSEYLHKLGMLMDFDPGSSDREVPDPYFGNFEGFEVVFRILTRACDGLVNELGRQISMS